MKYRQLPLALMLLVGRGEARTAGSLEGRVRLVDGVELEPTRITNTTDPEICGESQTLQDIVLSDDRGIQNVIVAVGDASGRKRSSSGTRHWVLRITGSSSKLKRARRLR